MVRFDYDRAGRRFLSQILHENNRMLSRTHSGVSDTSVAVEKRPLRLSGEALIRRVRENEERAHRFLFQAHRNPAPTDGGQVLGLLWAMADRINDGLLPTGERLRTWSIPARRASGAEPTTEAEVPPDALGRALDHFAAEVHHRWGELDGDPVPLAAWAEWTLNGGPLHPFYDGCGRISRAFAALLLVRASCLLPLYDDPDTYFAHGRCGGSAFAGYVRSRIDHCARWVESAMGRLGSPR